MVFLPFLLFLSILIKIKYAMEESALYRNPTGDFFAGDFKPNPFQYLLVKKITSRMLEDQFYCTFLCVAEPKCYSFNMAAYPDSKGLYLCELLATDKYREAKKFHANATFHHYSPWSPCESDPCKNGADCVPEYELNSYRCHCKLGFCGIYCEYRENNKTCSDIKVCNPKAKSGSYVIDPDGDLGTEPFTVHCDMTDKNEVGVTVVGHDSENRMLVDGYGDKGSYVRDVHYFGVGLFELAQLASLVASSSYCEQFIKFECRNTVLFYNGEEWGWWVSRDFVAMNYWGGATSADSYKCACGLTNTCADTSFGCNCDKNDSPWREDSGLLTEKAYLPVVQLKFGDTDSPDEKGYHTLGKFKCYGIA